MQSFQRLFSFFSSVRGSIGRNCSLTRISLRISPISDKSSRTPVFRNFQKIDQPPFSPRIVAAAALLLTAAPVLAGHYELVKDKEMELCKLYQRNIEKSATVHENARCDRPVDPSFAKQFGKPVWARINGKENIDLLVKANDYIDPIYDEHREMLERKGLLEEEMRSRRQGIEDLLITGQLIPELTQADLDNDGTLDPLLRWNQCGSAHALSGLPIIAFKPGLTEVDTVMMRPLKQNDDAGVTIWLFPGVNYDLFQYRGKTYFDVWQRAMEEDADRRPILRVLRDDRGKITEWCQYRFNENRASQNN